MDVTDVESNALFRVISLGEEVQEMEGLNSNWCTEPNEQGGGDGGRLVLSNLTYSAKLGVFGNVPSKKKEKWRKRKEKRKEK